MLKKISDALSRFAMLDGVKRVTVAVSGGADSVALLYALLKMRDSLGITVTAAHFNHKIRGEEAERDQHFVRDCCELLGVQLFEDSGDVPLYAKENHLSIELAARELRYRFFEGLDTDVIATAHTASDNLETVIHNLTRGTALNGLCGIPAKRGRFIRPLIFCTRQDVEDYCSLNDIEFINDSSNFCDDYTRNKIRHNVVPVLKSINSAAENCVSRMTLSLREDEDFIKSAVLNEYNKRYYDGCIDVKNFEEIHPAVAKRLIAEYYNRECGQADSLHINNIYEISLNGGTTSVCGNKSAIVRDGKLKIVDTHKNVVIPDFKVDISVSDNDLFKENKKVHNLLLKNTLDYDRIIGNLVCRTRQAGDSLRLKNKNGTKQLKKLFTEYKIPVDLRQVWPVLADDEGVVWVHKIGVADRCAADEDSKKLYKINVKTSFMGEL